MKNIIDIENATFDQIKENSTEALAIAISTPVEDLAKRYVEAIANSKRRDELLKTQGTTLTALEQGNQAMVEKVASLEAQLGELKSRSAALESHLQEHVTALNDERSRCERFRNAASMNMEAISSIAKISSDAMTAQHLAITGQG